MSELNFVLDEKRLSDDEKEDIQLSDIYVKIYSCNTNATEIETGTPTENGQNSGVDNLL